MMDRVGETGELLITLIRNACVNDGTPDSGQEVRSTDTLEAYLGSAGKHFEPHPGRRSTLFRVPGTDAGAPSLMLMGHLDVVPVNPDGWSCDPFAGERVDGFIWGRGAVDMLNLTAAMAVVFKRYLTGQRAPLRGDLLFLGAADEEAAGHLGAGWITENHWDDVACDYLLTEIGTPSLPTPHGPGLPVMVAEKGPHWRRITASGTPGHGSQPHGSDNALIPVADAVARLGRAPLPVDITAEWRRFLKAWGPGADLEEALVDPDRVDDAIDRIALDDPGLARWVHASTHLTISPTILHAGTKANVVPDLASAELDVRVLPGQDESTVLDHFRKVLGPALIDEVNLVPVETEPAGGSLPAGPLWDAIGDAVRVVGGATRLLPTLSPVATDARFFRRRGTVAYGVGLFDDTLAFGDFLSMFHGHDERVSEASLDMTTALLSATVEGFRDLA